MTGQGGQQGGTSPEHAVGRYLEPMRRAIRAGLARLPAPLAEFVLFGLKQAWACLFAAIMLTLLIGTKLVWDPAWPIQRYDALFVAALVVQVAMLAFRMESVDELKVILVYHVVGTIMEIFKTRMGSWSYPEAALIRIEGVPLFTGFMYGCVGSYMARAIRIFDMRFTHYPPLWATALLAAAIYANFFAHHFFVDLRWVLFAWTFLLFWRVRIYFTTDRRPLWMPLLVAAFLTACFLWIAENVGTITGTWLYPGQHGAWKPVSFSKLGSWYLLLVISFVLVTLVNRPKPPDAVARV
ncbi:DUF817 domain-containing protein [Prosthecomicrobium hirschii]|uniref:DUF817 domain-containing protein n=1 Tax=Prosthecodimorpha hirschii TaxID=665126 RepID=UPI003B8A7BEB